MVCICTRVGVFQLQQQGVISPGKQNYLIVAALRAAWLAARQHSAESQAQGILGNLCY